MEIHLVVEVEGLSDGDDDGDGGDWREGQTKRKPGGGGRDGGCLESTGRLRRREGVERIMRKLDGEVTVSVVGRWGKVRGAVEVEKRHPRRGMRLKEQAERW